MLHALGIYIQNGNTLEKIKQAQQEKNKPASYMLYKAEEKVINQLENIDNILYESEFYSTMQPNQVYKVKTDREFDYLYKASKTSTIYVISSRSELDPTEKAFLFKNMEHILIRPERVKATLDDIIANPQGFTGRDLLIGRVQDEMQELIAIMQKNIEMVIKRGESLENLKEKAVDLNKHAISFEDKAKKLNSCCW